MAVGGKQLGASALAQRIDGGDDQQPRVDREKQRSEETESRGVGGRRLVHRFTILTVCGAMVTSLVAWAAFLVYAAAWVVGAIS
jgi:Flp pilus assembly protein TadB